MRTPNSDAFGQLFGHKQVEGGLKNPQKTTNQMEDMLQVQVVSKSMVNAITLIKR